MPSNDYNHSVDVDRYISGNMEDEEALAFEAKCLSDEGLRADLEASYLLKLGAAGLGQTEVENLLTNVSDHDAKVIRKPKVWWKKPIPLWQVAALLVIFVLPAVYQSGESLQSQSLAGQLNVVSFSVSSMRGGVASTIDIHQTGSPLVLSTFINPSLTGGKRSTYSLDILDQDNESTKFALSNIQPTDQGMLYFNLGAATFAPGDYTFTLYQERDGEESALLKQGVITFN